MIRGRSTGGPVLWASLALNLFLVALIGAHLLRPEPARPHGLDAAIDRMAAVLPTADATKLHAVLAAARPHYMPAHAAMEQARSAVAQAIGRTPFDPQALATAMQTWRADWLTFMQNFGNGFEGAVGTLSPEGRTRLAGLLAHPERESRQ